MNLPLIIGAVAVSFFLFWGLLSIIKTSFKTALIVTLIVFGLQMGFKISPQQVLNQVTQFGSGIGAWFMKWGNTNKPPSDFHKESIQWLLESIFNV
jgi:hypothetical protein